MEKNYLVALERLNYGLKLQPNHIQMLLKKGKTLIALNKFIEAKEVLNIGFGIAKKQDVDAKEFLIQLSDAEKGLSIKDGKSDEKLAQKLKGLYLSEEETKEAPKVKLAY